MAKHGRLFQPFYLPLRRGAMGGYGWLWMAMDGLGINSSIPLLSNFLSWLRKCLVVSLHNYLSGRNSSVNNQCETGTVIIHTLQQLLEVTKRIWAFPDCKKHRFLFIIIIIHNHTLHAVPKCAYFFTVS